jgi:hypothetical protein
MAGNWHHNFGLVCRWFYLRCDDMIPGDLVCGSTLLIQLARDTMWRVRRWDDRNTRFYTR